MVTIHPKESSQLCPMASFCKGMSEKPIPLAMTITPGLILILIGIVVLLEPKVLVWLVAGVTILIGVLLVMLAVWIRRIGAFSGHAHG